MGKIKEHRFRGHPSLLKKSTSKVNLIERNVAGEDNVVPTPLPPVTSDIFSGVNIDLKNVVKSLDNKFDTTSVSGRSHRELKKEEQHLPKKEKMRRRHERFLEKLDIIYSKQSKKQKKRLITKHDVEPLLVSPPSNDCGILQASESVAKTKKAQAKKSTARPSMKAKKRRKEDLKDVKQFQRVLNNSIFRTNPALAIKQFLQQKVAEKRPDLQLLP